MNMNKKHNIAANGLAEEVRFTSYEFVNERQEYLLEQSHGPDKSAPAFLSQDFDEFQVNSIEHALLDFIRTGDPAEILNRGLWVTENPGKNEISRNLSLYDPATNIEYTLGGIGFVRLDKDTGTLHLSPPIIETSFHKYQIKRGNNEGGTLFYSEDGISDKKNTTPVGVVFYTQGPYNLLDKIKKTQSMIDEGFNAPQYIAAGCIKNLSNGKFGFSIYKTQLTQDYQLNLGLYIDKSINFKANFFQYITSKYKQLAKLHLQLGLTHGQPTITNAVGEIRLKDGEHSFGCVIKDLATLSPIPKQVKKTITESPCPQSLQANVKKSPKVAAIINDLQIALTQEFNILLIAMSALPNDDIKLKFLNYQYPILMRAICESYGLLKEQETNQLIQFSFSHFIKSLKLGYKISVCNEVLGGLSAHAMLGLSADFRNEIEFIG